MYDTTVFPLKLFLSTKKTTLHAIVPRYRAKLIVKEENMCARVCEGERKRKGMDVTCMQEQVYESEKRAR